jgi:DNA mismatch repair protein MutH
MMHPPTTESALLERCQAIEGFSFAQLAAHLNLCIPSHALQRKGWAGQAIERALGTNASTRSAPDFMELGIELKTLPINHLGKPAQSTFVTTIPLLTIHQQTWCTSQCFAKLRRVLWMPVEDDPNISFPHRRIGRALLWSPSPQDEKILEQDWLELSLMIGTGQLTEVDASMGQFLQVRPKAANAKCLCYGFDAEGNKILTLPRGFYLRASFTATLSNV